MFGSCFDYFAMITYNESPLKWEDENKASDVGKDGEEAKEQSEDEHKNHDAEMPAEGQVEESTLITTRRYQAHQCHQ